MARIRTVKPDLFRHLELFQAEQETGLPLRIAYVGLWSACDREGRFKWIPEMLKLDILPYDNIDFSRVLDAWGTRGFVVKYRVGDAWYGCIPSWTRHQIINNRETESVLPHLDIAEEIIDACPTRAPRQLKHAQGEGKGREGKGKGTGREREAFSKPTPDEIREYCIERKNGINPEKFLSHYESNGWKVGRNPMKDWKAAIRTWERMEGTFSEGKAQPKVYSRTSSLDLGEPE